MRFAFLAVGVCFCLSAFARPEEAKVPESVACAVMPDHKVNVAEATKKGLYQDVEYTRYYFCCDNCPKAFAKDPDKFTKNGGVDLQAIGVPKEIHCSVMTDEKVDVEKALDNGKYADYNGRRYFFCCDGCPAAFKKEPDKYTKNASISLGQFPLPKEIGCPVMAGRTVTVKEALEKKLYADYKGRRYFFCCAECPNEFKSEPGKYATNASLPSPKVEEKKKSE